MNISGKSRRDGITALVGVTGLILASAALAQTEISRGAVIASTCYACHGTHGISPGNMPSINDISAERMTSMLKGFSSGMRASTVMGRHASGYTEEEINDVAQYLGKLRTGGKQ